MLMKEAAKMLESTELVTRKSNIALIQGLRVCQHEMLEYAKGVHVRKAFGELGVGAVAGENAKSLLEEELTELSATLDMPREKAIEWLKTRVLPEKPLTRSDGGNDRT